MTVHASERRQEFNAGAHDSQRTRFWVQSNTAAGMKLAEIRKRALHHGLAIRNHKGGYMIVDRYGAMLAGEGFTLTLEDVEALLRAWNVKKVQQRLGK